MQDTRSVYFHFKKLKKKLIIQVCQLVDCSNDVVAVILKASTRILNLNTVRHCRCPVLSELFLIRGMVRNEIPRVGFYFCSTERNSELFSLPLNGSEGNSESLLLFWSTERNSELFSLPWKSLERNSENFFSAEQAEFRRK